MARLLPLVLVMGLSVAGCESNDARLRTATEAAGVEPLDPGEPADAERVELGRMLFFDPILSGNRDTSCATCHHPIHGTSDAMSLGIGTGGHGLGPDRIRDPERDFIPRNSPDIFNRGSEAWHTLFWDMRVAHEGYDLSAPEALPDSVQTLLAAQAMFPVTSETRCGACPAISTSRGNRTRSHRSSTRTRSGTR